MKLHVVVTDAGVVAAKLRAALESGGIAVQNITPIAPTLEDVFVSVIEARDRMEGAQQEYRQ